MKKIIFLTLIIASHLFANAQTADDALRYSLTKYNSTARSAAMGGAFGALGGDFSSISINPAGLGVFRSSELTLSTNFRMSKAKNNGFEEDKLSFVIDNLGAVFVFNENLSKTGWQGINLAFGYNAMNNFNTRSISRVDNSPNSMTDVWEKEANIDLNNNIALNDFSAGLAYNVELIDFYDSEDFYSTVLGANDLVNQRKFIKEEGYQGEYVFAIGTNYSNKLYLGLSLGVQHIYYKSRSNYSENTVEGAESKLNNFSSAEFLKNTGDGINIKLGLIYKPTDYLRLGIAYHSPTYFNMREKYYVDLEANYTQDDETYNLTSLSPVNEFEYDLRTPARTILSGAYVFGKRAILSVDYEYIDYSGAKYSEGEFGDFGDRDYLDNINMDIKDSYKSTFNIKVGGEYRVNSNVSLRAGYALYKSPYESGTINENSDRKLLSGGVGFRQGNFFLDLAYVNTRFNEYSAYYAFDDVQSDIVKIKNNFNDFKITLGVKF